MSEKCQWVNVGSMWKFECGTYNRAFYIGTPDESYRYCQYCGGAVQMPKEQTKQEGLDE